MVRMWREMELEVVPGIRMSFNKRCLGRWQRLWSPYLNGLCSRPGLASYERCPDGEGKHYQMDEPMSGKPLG